MKYIELNDFKNLCFLLYFNLSMKKMSENKRTLGVD